MQSSIYPEKEWWCAKLEHCASYQVLTRTTTFPIMLVITLIEIVNGTIHALEHTILGSSSYFKYKKKLSDPKLKSDLTQPMSYEYRQSIRFH